MESKVCHTLPLQSKQISFKYIPRIVFAEVYLCNVSILQLKLKLFSGKSIMNMNFPIGLPGLVYNAIFSQTSFKDQKSGTL